MTAKRIYSIGHSTLPIEQFLGLLGEHGVRLVADIRRFPASRRYPWFARQALQQAVEAAGLEYRWLAQLGGYRGALRPDSPHLGLRVAGFRNYADYMATAEFHAAAGELMGLAESWPAAYMCAERLYWRCHRMLLSDFLVVRGWEVVHILEPGKTVRHKLTQGAVVEAGQLLYLPGGVARRRAAPSWPGYGRGRPPYLWWPRVRVLQ